MILTYFNRFIFETRRDGYSESQRIIKDAEDKIKETLQPLLERAEVTKYIFVFLFHFLVVTFFNFFTILKDLDLLSDCILVQKRGRLWN